MNYIVATSINPPTNAIRKFDAMPDWKLIVVGDLKTPLDYHLERGSMCALKSRTSTIRSSQRHLGGTM